MVVRRVAESVFLDNVKILSILLKIALENDFKSTYSIDRGW